MDLALNKGFLARTLGGLVLLGGLASHAQAGTFGICVLPGVSTALGTSSADYSTAVVTAGCIPGFSTSLQPSATLNPTSLGAGLTTATLTLSQPMTSGGTAVAIATASIDQGAIHLYGDSQGTPIGCGGSCQTTGGSAFPEALFDDTLHFIITDTATSAIGTFQAHLDGVIGLESDSEGSFGSYSVSESFLFGGGSGCWGSQTNLTPGPGRAPDPGRPQPPQHHQASGWRRHRGRHALSGDGVCCRRPAGQLLRRAPARLARSSGAIPQGVRAGRVRTP